jgi:hypothetical protein
LRSQALRSNGGEGALGHENIVHQLSSYNTNLESKISCFLAGDFLIDSVPRVNFRRQPFDTTTGLGIGNLGKICNQAWAIISRKIRGRYNLDRSTENLDNSPKAFHQKARFGI